MARERGKHAGELTGFARIANRVFIMLGVLAFVGLAAAVAVPMVTGSSSASTLSGVSQDVAAPPPARVSASPTPTPTPTPSPTPAPTSRTVLDPNAVADPYNADVIQCPEGTIAGTISPTGNQSDCHAP